jgi:hypothetical protein
MKLFAKEITFTTEHFEIIVTFSFMVVAGIIGALNLPNQIPISVPQFVVLSSIIGFAFGYGVSSYIVAQYKQYKKNRAK